MFQDCNDAENSRHFAAHDSHNGLPAYATTTQAVHEKTHRVATVGFGFSGSQAGLTQRGINKSDEHQTKCLLYRRQLSSC